MQCAIMQKDWEMTGIAPAPRTAGRGGGGGGVAVQTRRNSRAAVRARTPRIRPPAH